MPIFESDMLLETMKEREQDSVCEQCSANLIVVWAGLYGRNEFMLRCTQDANHDGIVRPYRPHLSNIPGGNPFKISNRRKQRMERQLGTERAKALMPYAQAVLKTETEATKVLRTIWPEAPREAMAKAAMICVQYQLNPLMKHVYLICFNKGNPKERWETVLGIQANRLIAHRAGDFSYLDDTPRIMTEDEQLKIFGEVMEDRIWAITKGRDSRGNTAQGYGCWLRSEIPYGVEKGNTKANMAFIRSERQFFDRLFAGKMPSGVEVIDTSYTEVGEQIDMPTDKIAQLEPTNTINPANEMPAPYHATPADWNHFWGQCAKWDIPREEVPKRLGMTPQEWVAQSGTLDEALAQLNPNRGHQEVERLF